VAVAPSPADVFPVADEVPLADGRFTARHAVDGGSAAANSFVGTVSNTDEVCPIRSAGQEVRCAPR
jgi:hypothetical protein